MKESTPLIDELKKWKQAIIALSLVFLFSFFSSNADWVEKYYSTGIYPYISRTQRFIFGWIPFSVGDFIYIITIIWIIHKAVLFLKKIKLSFKTCIILIRKTIQTALWIYLLFNILWGLNYYRAGFTSQLNIKPNKYSTEDLKYISQNLIKELNFCRKQITLDERNDTTALKIFKHANTAYSNSAKKLTFLTYNQKSIKPSIFNTMGNYLGFLGYYNPFTGEAQVNTKIPSFILPFTTCHEIGHQLGYANESEASFAGYLCSINAENMMFKYSALFELFLISNKELYFTDSSFARQNLVKLDTLVMNDIKQYRNYLLANENSIEPYFTDLYNSYLIVNNQPEGIKSYDEVLAWVIAYYRKFTSL